VVALVPISGPGHQHTFTIERKHFAGGAKKGEKRGKCKVCGK
jgi:hypothetical protein